MPGKIDQRLAELKLELPNPASPMANYVPAVRTGNLLYVSGQICQWNGERRFTGKLGGEISIEQGKEAAKLCGLLVRDCPRLRILATSRSVPTCAASRPGTKPSTPPICPFFC